MRVTADPRCREGRRPGPGILALGGKAAQQCRRFLADGGTRAEQRAIGAGLVLLRLRFRSLVLGRIDGLSHPAVLKDSVTVVSRVPVRVV